MGSYARGEQTKKSDVDVLVITGDTNGKIRREKYEIILILETILENNLKTNIISLFPMLKEAKTIINKGLVKKYISIKLNKKNLAWHVSTTKTALRVQKAFISLAEIERENISDGIIYSLVLRLRGVYLVDCFKNNKKATNKGLRKLVRDLTNSEESYEAYLRSKLNEKEQIIIKVEAVKKIYDYIEKKIKEQNG